jgi:hypothetical protein
VGEAKLSCPAWSVGSKMWRGRVEGFLSPTPAYWLCISADRTRHKPRGPGEKERDKATIKTFYSTVPMSCIPKQADVTRDSPIRLHNDTIKLEEQRVSDIEWEYTPKGVTEDRPPAYQKVTAEDGRPSASSGCRT